LRSLLKKVAAAEQSSLDVTKTVRSEILKRTKTQVRTSKLWHGGGGVTHLEVGPSMFEQIEGVIVLAAWATRGELAKAMCAQLECPMTRATSGAVRPLAIKTEATECRS
jgi:hypothetical protein